MQLNKFTFLIALLTAVLSAVVLFAQCQSECPVDEVKWVTIVDTTRYGGNLEFQVELNAVLEKDMKELEAKGNGQGTYRVNSFLKNYREREAKVSQEFYQAYLSKRSQICALYISLEKDNFKDLSSRKDAEIQYLAALKELGQIGGGQVKTIAQKANELRSQYAGAASALERKISQLNGPDAITGTGYLDIFRDQLRFLETDIRRYEANEISAREFEVNLVTLGNKLEEYKNLIQAL